MFQKNGFSFTVKGTNSGIFVPAPCLKNIFDNKKYINTILTIKSLIDLNFLKESLFSEAYQSQINKKDEMFNLYVFHSVINNLIKLDKNDINGDKYILSNSNTIFAYFPEPSAYLFKDMEKLNQYPLEINFLKSLYNEILKLNVDYEIVKELFLELILNWKNKKFQSKNPYLKNLSEIKNFLLENKVLLKLIDDFNSEKIFININKQGKDGNNNIYYQSPVYISQSAKTIKEELTIENFKPQLQEINTISLPSLHPILFQRIESVNVLEPKDLFKLANYYKEIMKDFIDYKKDNLDWEIILRDILKLKEDFKKRVFVEIKQYKKEINLKTVWYDVGKKISLGVYFMHKGKKGKDLYKSIASSKEELVNNISPKKPEKKAKLILEKYLVKFGVNLEGNNPEDFKQMDSLGFQEFLIGLYLKTEKEEEI